MKVPVTRIFLIFGIFLVGDGVAAEKFIDITGTYVENGMTIRATPGMPKENVSLCALLSTDFSRENHKVLARSDRYIEISQTDELLLRIYIHGGLPGTCVYEVTNAEGLRVTPEILEFRNHPKNMTVVFRFGFDGEKRLVLTVNIIDPKSRISSTAPPTQEAVYAFPSAPKLKDRS